MGQVVQMLGWKERKLKAIRDSKGKQPSVELKPSDRATALKTIESLIRDSFRQDDLVKYGREVDVRERAAICSMRLLFEAHKIADANGYRITCNTEGGFKEFTIHTVV